MKHCKTLQDKYHRLYKDKIFSRLRVWRDLNQDGISQSNELSTLFANRITSIGVNANSVNADLGNGNVQSATGTYTRSNGTTGETGEFSGTAGNLDLLTNTFYRDFEDSIPLSEQARKLPTLFGSGQVRDLNEAISLSPELGNLVDAYTQQTTCQAQINMLDSFIEKWAATSKMKSLKEQAGSLASHGVELTYRLEGLTSGTAAYDTFLKQLGIVERFMGFTYGGETGQARTTPLNTYSGKITVTLEQSQIDSIRLAYERFKGDIYESLLATTRLLPYTLILLETGAGAKNFASLEQTFSKAILTNPQQGIVDLFEFISAIGEKNLSALGWDAMSFLSKQLDTAPELSGFREELSSWTVHLYSSAGLQYGINSARPYLLVGTATADTITGGSDDDYLFGRGGNDSLTGDKGNDILDGGAGDDALASGGGYDTYIFGRGYGKDTVTGYDSGLADVIQLKSGIAPEDIQLKNNDGSLVLLIKGGGDRLSFQNALDRAIGEIRFADGTVWDKTTIFQKIKEPTDGDDVIYSDSQIGCGGSENNQGLSGNDTLYGNEGSDTLSGGTGDDTLYGKYGCDWLSGDEGNDTLYGGDLEDDLSGGAGQDILYGGGWNDILYGGEGNDILYGGSSNDELHGGAGDDILDGEQGSDYLNGEAGNDTYIFGRGSGKDTISSNLSGSDKVVFGADVSESQIWFKRNGYDLELSLIGTTDKLVIGDWYKSANIPGSTKMNNFLFPNNLFSLLADKKKINFVLNNGKELNVAKLDALVEAMSVLTPPANGVTTLPANYRTTLAPMIAASWQ